MTTVANILSSGVQAIDLGDEYETLKAVETIYNRWSDIKDALGRTSSAATFLADLDTELNNPDVTGALTTLGLGDELDSIKRVRGRVSNFFKKIGIDHPERLLARLSDNTEDNPDGNDGMVAWSLIKKDPSTIADGAFGKGDFNLDLGGSAMIEVEGGALWPYKKDEVTQRLVRMGVAGDLSAKGKFKTPFSLGPLSGSAGGKVDADASIELDYYFDPADQSTLLAGAIANRIKRLPNPLDYASVISAYNSGEDFFGFDFSKAGGVSAEVEVSIGKGLDLADIGKIAAEVTVKATLLRRRQFQISLRRLDPAHLGDPKTRLAVSGKRVSKDGKSIGIQVVLEFGELAKHVHSKLEEEFISKWDTTLKQIKPYLTPGTYLQNEAKELIEKVVGELISNRKIAEAVTADMDLLLGTSEDNDLKLGAYFTDQIKGALNGLVSSLVGDVEEQAADLLAGLKERLPLFAELDQDDFILTELKKLTGRVSSDFEAELTKRTVNNKKRREEIAETLAEIGRSANGVVESADKAAAKVRELVGEADRIVKKTMELLSNSAKQEARLSLTYSTMKSTEASFELVAHLSPDLTQEDYRKLLSGNFNDTRALLMRAEDPNKPTTIEFQDGTKVKSISEDQSKFQGSFMVFGFGTEWTNVFDGKAEIEVDHRGNVEITTRGSGTKKSRTLIGKEETEASFIDVISLARAKEGAKAGVRPSIDLALSLKRTDSQGMNEGEFGKLIEHTKRFSLVTKEGRQEVTDAYTQWGKSGDHRGVPVTAELKLPLTSDQIMRVVERGNPNTTDPLLHSHNTVQTAVDALYSAYSRSGSLTDLDRRLAQDRAWGFELARRLPGIDGTDSQVIFSLGSRNLRRSFIENNLRLVGRRAGDEKQAFDQLHEWSKRAVDLYELCKELYQISNELPDVAAGRAEWTGPEYAARQKRIAKKTEDWLATGKFMAFFGTDGLDRNMAAFFLALGGLAGLSYEDVASTVTLTLTNTKEGGNQVVVR